MHPSITLSHARLRANLLAWQRYCARPVWAVLKADGYGWGASRLAAALHDVAAGFYVADADEFFALRGHTAAPIALLGDTSGDALARVLDAGGIPTLSTPGAVSEAIAWAACRGRVAAVRVGLSAAVGWSGMRPEEVPLLAAACSGGPLRVTLWTHVTATERAREQAQALQDAARMFRAYGVDVAGLDCGSTASAHWLAGELPGDHVRIGLGLFGARGGAGEGGPGLACALDVRAPVITRSVSEVGRHVGYGATDVEAGRPLVTVRCGYGDGFPRGIAGSENILAVGMQYTTLLADDAESDSTIALIDETTDLDALALRARCLPHEIVVGLGVHSAARDRLHGIGSDDRG